MKYPIIFSPAMIQAILSGRKTMTRRLIKPQPIWDKDSGFYYHGKHKERYRGENWKDPFLDDWAPWMPGDLLWVKENFIVQQVDKVYEVAGWQNHVCIDFPASKPGATDSFRKWFWLPADETPRVIRRRHPEKVFTSPSIFLPMLCARIWLQVEEIKIERLWNISNEDAVAEGVEKGFDKNHPALYRDYTDLNNGYRSPVNSFFTLWDTIHEGGEFTSEKDPWLWCTRFKLITIQK